MINIDRLNYEDVESAAFSILIFGLVISVGSLAKYGIEKAIEINKKKNISKSVKALVEETKTLHKEVLGD